MLPAFSRDFKARGIPEAEVVTVLTREDGAALFFEEWEVGGIGLKFCVAFASLRLCGSNKNGMKKNRLTVFFVLSITVHAQYRVEIDPQTGKRAISIKSTAVYPLNMTKSMSVGKPV
ncbi:MAG: hypothetical protein IPJ40_13445 [Saprospirales bacterium]|nr:hypothetical protein [Saprospirales bacterium]